MIASQERINASDPLLSVPRCKGRYPAKMGDQCEAGLTFKRTSAIRCSRTVTRQSSKRQNRTIVPIDTVYALFNN